MLQSSLFDRVLRETAPSGPLVETSFDPHGLRPYQREAAGAALAKLGGAGSTLIVMATGLGKTQTFGAIAAGWPGRVLVLAHREELLDQARVRLQAMAGELVGLEQADFWAGDERIVVASVQSLVNSKRRERFKVAPFSLIIIDEAHHTTAKSYRKILETFPEAKKLGVTATPDRGDGTALGDIFETVAYERGIETGISDGYLVPVSVRQVILEQVDLSKVSTTAGDLNLGQLDEEMVKANHAVAEATLREAGDRKTIVFSTKVETAHDLAATFNKLATRRVAAAVDGETPTEQRRALLREHAAGGFQFLVNVGIATEGYDSPGVACVAIARPTKSRALYTQMAGRGLRVLPGLVEGLAAVEARKAAVEASAKPNCLLLDFVGNAGRHKLLHPLDVLGGKLPEDVEERAKKILTEKAMDARAAERLARDQLAAERRARAEALAAYRATVKARTVEVDPFRHGGDEREEGDLGRETVPPSQKQLDYLVSRFRVKKECLPRTRKAAADLINHLSDRSKRNLATWPQTQTLGRYGISARELSMATASKVIDAIASNGWKLPARHVVEAIINAPREPGMEG
ncbi:MAG TPA: DEAD/DEAH box helicase [Terriglobales bacterium]|nr:DEAD/DEAH box helicase [Terriglobales bacterium]